MKNEVLLGNSAYIFDVAESWEIYQTGASLKYIKNI